MLKYNIIGVNLNKVEYMLQNRKIAETKCIIDLQSSDFITRYY